MNMNMMRGRRRGLCRSSVSMSMSAMVAAELTSRRGLSYISFVQGGTADRPAVCSGSLLLLGEVDDEDCVRMALARVHEGRLRGRPGGAVSNAASRRRPLWTRCGIARATPRPALRPPPGPAAGPGSNPRSWVAPRAIFPGVGRAARVSSQSVDLSIPLSGKYRGSFAQAQRNCTHEAHCL